MVILLSAFACLPNYGTESGNGWNWAAHLVEARHTVHVLTRAVNQERIERYLVDNPLDNLTFTYVAAPRDKYWRHRDRGVYYLVWQAMALRAARRLTPTRKFDLVHHVTYGTFQVPTQLWRLGFPTIFGPVGGGQTAPDALLPYFGSAQKKERLRSIATSLLPYSPVHRASLKRISRVLATNRETLDLARRCGAPHVEFSFDSGLPESFFADRLRTPADFDGPLRMLWVGRILPRKGMAFALDVLRYVTCTYHLTIVGDAEGPTGSLSARIHSCGLGDKVANLGRLAWQQTRDYYLRSHCLLFTSLRESMGTQILEAAACGLPVMSLDLFGAREFITDQTGIRVPATTPEATARAFAAAIDCFAALSAEEKQRVSAASVARAATLEWHNRVRDMEHIYAEAIESVPGKDRVTRTQFAQD